MPDEINNTSNSELRFFVFLAVVLCLILIFSYLLGSKAKEKELALQAEVVEKLFPEISIQARAAYVYDARNETVLMAKNENTRLPLASLTKVMTALVANELSPDFGTITVTPQALLAHGDSGLRAWERWNLKDLLDFSLITSSNDGVKAVALALGALESSTASEEEVISSFVQEMNKKAASLNLKDTYFWNETGLDESEMKGGAYGTAKDISMLMDYIISYHPEIIEATRHPYMTVTSLDQFQHVAANTNALAGSIPGLIASKTGFTNTAGGNLTLVFDPELGRPIIVTILGSTERGRFEDAARIISAVMDYITTN